MKFQPVRGTRDLLGDECRRYRYIIDQTRAILSQYNYEEIITPIFEFSGVFNSVGETSDIVTKETYTFTDRSGQKLTLRPEGTASIMRAIVSNGLSQDIPIKLFYSGPMFRYERPQKGRYRQFNQIGIELVGVEEAFGDVEVILMAHHLLNELEILKKTTLVMNSLGDNVSRNAYRAILVEYLTKYVSELSDTSKIRLEKNPLRVLDSKDPGDRKILEEAPIYTDSLNEESRRFFDNVLNELNKLGIQYKINPRLVRGIDYYCHTIFEFIGDELGAQGAVIAGGRYDGLVKSCGGSDLAGTGWAAGVERMDLMITNEIIKLRPITFIPIGEEAESKILKLAQDLRYQGYVVDLSYSGSVNKRLKRSNKINAQLAIIVGADEIKAARATVRNLDSGNQEAVDFSKLSDYFAQHY
jgi:histidyl-tRNA synthetase